MILAGMTASSNSVRPATVLIADDLAANRAMIRMVLADSGYRVLEAVDGDEAWQVAQQNHPNVAILDLQMPKRSGVDVAQAIKRDPELSDVCVVLLSGQSDHDLSAAVQTSGADHYLTKPFSLAELRRIVQHCLERVP